MHFSFSFSSSATFYTVRLFLTFVLSFFFFRFSDLLGLYQALSLVVPMQPDLEIDAELQVQLLTVQAAFAHMVAERTTGNYVFYFDT